MSAKKERVFCQMRDPVLLKNMSTKYIQVNDRNYQPAKIQILYILTPNRRGQ